MSDISKVDLFVCYEGVEKIELPPYTVGVWRFSDTEDLANLTHLESEGITKPLIERYGRTVLCVDLNGDVDGTEAARERLSAISSDMPTGDTGICRLSMSTYNDDLSSLYIYGDNVQAAIDKLVAIKFIGKDDAQLLSDAYCGSMALDGIKVLNGDEARAAAANRVKVAPGPQTLERK